MKLVIVFPVSSLLVQNLRRFLNILHNRVIAWLQLLETLPKRHNNCAYNLFCIKKTLLMRIRHACFRLLAWKRRLSKHSLPLCLPLISADQAPLCEFVHYRGDKYFFPSCSCSFTTETTLWKKITHNSLLKCWNEDKGLNSNVYPGYLYNNLEDS